MNPRSVAFICVILLISACVPVGAVASEDSSESPVVAQTETTVPTGPPEINVSISQSEPGTAELSLTTSPTAANLQELQFAVSDGRIVNATGFTQKPSPDNDFEGVVYQWDGETEHPSLTLETSLEDTVDRQDQYRSTETWFFGQSPFVEAFWYRADDTHYSSAVVTGRSNGDVPRTGNISFTESGVAGQNYLYIGPYETQQIQEDKTTFTVVEVGSATITNPGAYTAEFLRAQPYLRGVQPRNATMFVMPDPMPRRGVAVPAADEFWVHEDSQRTMASNIWLHEYIHIQQTQTNFGAQMQWYSEGMTAYQTAVLSAQIGDVSVEESYQYLTQNEFEDVVLAERRTWAQTDAQYYEGSKMLFALDEKIREATTSNQTIQAVSQRVNTYDGQVTYAVFREIVVAESNERVGEWLDEQVLTNAETTPPAELLLFPASSQTDSVMGGPIEYVNPGSITKEDASPTPETGQTGSENDIIDDPTDSPDTPESILLIFGGSLLVLAGLGGVLRSKFL